MRTLKLQRHVEYVASILAFVAFCFVLGMLTGCAPLTPAQETTAKEVAAETAYGAELQMCVEMNESEAAIDQCADTVRAKYRLDGGAQ